MAEEEVIETTETTETTQTTEESAPWYSEDWRQHLAGDDEKALNQLGRYKTPADVWNKARALEQRLSSGELKDNSPFPTDGTPEQQAAWREMNGVPESAENYQLPEGVGEDEKAALDGFLKHAHANNFTNDEVNAMLGFFEEQGKMSETQQSEVDAEMEKATEDKLRAEWAGDYRGHMNRIESLLDTFPEGQGDLLRNARLADGSLLKNHPDAMKFLLDAALALNPATTLTDDGKGGTIDSIQDELQSIRQIMRTDRRKYDGDAKMQERYRQLLVAEQKLQKKGAA